MENNYEVVVPIVVNSDKFREAALHFTKFGYYTAAPRGTTEYKKYWDRELHRCVHGFTSDDGEFISGYFYFYLNYSRIIITKEEHITDSKGKSRRRAARIESFPDFYDYDWAYFNAIEEAENSGKHMVVLKKRGAGYSYKGASMLNRNFYCIPRSKSYAIASEMEFLTKDGLLTKAWDMMNFVDTHTAFGKKRQKIDRSTHKRASFVYEDEDSGVKIEAGWGSEIIGISLKNDAQKARGKRGKLILWEEAGKFPNLKQAWQIARPSVEDGNIAFGLMVAYGTGGTVGADYEGLKELFYEPNVYNALPFKNTWDESPGDKPCGFFVPWYYNMSGADESGVKFIDKDGNSNLKIGIRWSLKERDKLMAASDKNTIDIYIAERPFTPEEATLQISGNLFPKKELLRHLNDIRTSKSLSSLKQIGELRFSDKNELKWTLNPKLKDHTTYRLDKGKDKSGAIVIWEHPTENPPFGLYIGGCLTPGEQVLTHKGLMNVEDVTLDDLLINKDGVEVKINALLRYDKKEEFVYKINMNSVSRPTTYTKEHPLYISDDWRKDDFSFVEAKDVKEGQWTKYPNVYNKERDITEEFINKKGDNILLEDDFWWFVGHWLGDGFNHNIGHNYTIYNSFGKKETEYLEKYKNIVNNLFCRKPNLKLQNGSGTHKFEYKKLFEFLEKNFGKYANGKYISEWVKYIPIRYKLQLILGYLDSDGSVYEDRSLIMASFKSINITLLNDVQDILFSLGIVSRFNLSDKNSTYSINGKNGLTKDSYSLKIGKVELKKLADLYESDYNSRKLRLAKQTELLQKARINTSCIMSGDNKYIYIKIKSIDKHPYSGIVYNFDCETHTFVTQYCTSHNCDPYDHDSSTTDSLGSLIIYKRFQNFENYYDIPVAEYTGRPESAEEFYETCRKLIMYYNATVLYENEKKGLFTYFSQKHCEYLLADQPDIIKDVVSHSRVTRGKGIHMSKEIKAYGETLIRDWLNEEYAPGRKNLTKIFSEPLLEELISFNMDGNFDRVIAFILVMIYKQELYNHTVKKREDTIKKELFTKPLFKYDLDFEL